jgi:hypothetical protein
VPVGSLTSNPKWAATAFSRRAASLARLRERLENTTLPELM